MSAVPSTHGAPSLLRRRADLRSLRCLVAVGLVAQWTMLICSAADLSFDYEANVRIPMRDGTKLSANIFRPKDSLRHPVLLMRSPYGKPDEKSGDAKKHTAAGYVMVVQDCRGKGQSEGVWDPFAFDTQDGFDTQEWIGAQSWSNGEIGTFGGSYLGWTQWASAANASRFLKCMVPIVPFADVYEDLAYPGGAFQLALLMGWGSGVGGIALSPEKLKESFQHLPLHDFADQFEKKVSYLNDWVTHNTRDEYWKRRGIEHDYENVTVPVLNIGGWYDIFSKTTLDQVAGVRAKSKSLMARRNQFVVMGPWAHGVGLQKVGQLDFGTNALLRIGDLQFQWFEYWLRHQPTGVENWPACRLFVMGENRWRDEHEWPLKRTVFTHYYLHSEGHANTAAGNGVISTETPAEEPSDTYVYDPANPVPSHGGNNLVGASAGPMDQSQIEERSDVLVYSTPPLKDPVEVTGPVRMVIQATSTASDTDFTAKLIDVYPNGKAYNLCEGIIRTSAPGSTPIEAGKMFSREIDLWVTSNLFDRGHRIRVEVSSSNFPRYDRNPNTGKPFGRETKPILATQTIHHSMNQASHLVLPVIPR